MKPKKLQIFFAVSHLESLGDLKYKLASESNKFKLSEELSETKIIEDNVDFKVQVFSISFDESNITNCQYELEINLDVANIETFTGKIKFNKNKNNFIYDFSFDILHKEKEDLRPPPSLNLSYYDKFYLFNKVLKDKYQDNEQLFNSLLEDSFNLLKMDCDYYYIDFYLSLFTNSYKSSKIIELLSYFDFKKIKRTEKINIEEISPVLNEVKNDPELITKYANENEKDKYKEIIYSIILYYSINYDSNKINELLEEKNANKYYQKILYSNQDYFIDIELQNSFVDEMINNGFEFNYENFILTLKYLKTLENILVFINKHTKMIYELLKNKKTKKDDEDNEENEEEEENEENIKDKKINLCDIIKIKYNGNINNISKEINTLLDKQYIFEYIELGEEFWKKYSEFFNKQNLNILLEIKKILENIKNKKSDLVKDINFINKFIHDTGIEMSKMRKFRNNIEILEFIKEKDIYYTSKSFKKFRDVNIFVGLNFSMGKEEKIEFLKLWKTFDFNEMFDEEQYMEFQKIIISNICHISLFHLIFQLFGEYNENNSNNYENIILLRDKYNSLIQLVTQKNLSDINDVFIEDSSNLIYILAQKKGIGKSFIQKDLLKKLPLSINNKIFLKLLSKFKDIPDNIIEEIADYFSKGKDNLICENLINNFKRIDNIKCKRLILNKISNSLIINKEMIYYEKEKKSNKSFNRI